ncbi:MAG TPA: hypothetical protein VED40_11300 [Azospirillaceae bacterium]|nr:hypothetical protein [Azospirillaceae bacterium]
MESSKDTAPFPGSGTAPADVPLQWQGNDISPVPFGFGEMPADPELRQRWQEARTRLMREALDSALAARTGPSRNPASR